MSAIVANAEKGINRDVRAKPSTLHTVGVARNFDRHFDRKPGRNVG
jgi:hypothetical protein